MAEAAPMNALLIIDYQQAVFLGEPACHRSHEVAAVLAAAARRARSASWAVIFIRHEAPGTPWDRDSPGWLFPDALRPEPGDEIVDKTSCDAFRGTSLQELLHRRGIEGLTIGGYATEFCVDTTVRSAAAREFRTTVLADGHTTRDRPHMRAPAIVEHHNWVWPRISNPGNPIRVLPAQSAVP
jgi:nicotinamidase-related amidase